MRRTIEGFQNFGGDGTSRTIRFAVRDSSPVPLEHRRIVPNDCCYVESHFDRSVLKDFQNSLDLPGRNHWVCSQTGKKTGFPRKFRVFFIFVLIFTHFVLFLIHFCPLRGVYRSQGYPRCRQGTSKTPEMNSSRCVRNPRYQNFYPVQKIEKVMNPKRHLGACARVGLLNEDDL